MTKHDLLENFHQSPITYLIIGIVLIVSIIALLNKNIFYKLILHPQSVVRDREYYRMITSDLTNADFTHLMVNVLMLYVFCGHLEFTLRQKSAFGSMQFLVIYLSSLFLASGIITYKYKRQFDYSTTGTSGSIMGCMLGFMILDPNYVVFDLPGIGKVINVYAALLYILIMLAYQLKKRNELVNIEYHFWGALGGIIATILIHPWVS